MLFSTLFAIKEEAYANNGWVLLAMPSTSLVSTSWNMQFLQQAAETFDKHVPMLRPALRINFTALWALYQDTASMGKYDSDHRLSPSIERPYSPL
ncbi:MULTISPECIES: hypothetical protein [Photorhabdus]|uniref:Uncharacterized protein n=1 Tax=Photorhabdus asymbiotica subsp. asymbiotica (strain ATCC 43949 / 3105-77) TaxID=553480 RepID=C7BGR1_PHOAA|nr:hypothetical protein [Photorhabdus asymbiotica]CAQ82240.1 Hypothetical protein PAU_00147 [Photorhabdus asymbiotica]